MCLTLTSNGDEPEVELRRCEANNHLQKWTFNPSLQVGTVFDEPSSSSAAAKTTATVDLDADRRDFETPNKEQTEEEEEVEKKEDYRANTERQEKQQEQQEMFDEAVEEHDIYEDTNDDAQDDLADESVAGQTMSQFDLIDVN